MKSQPWSRIPRFLAIVPPHTSANAGDIGPSPVIECRSVSTAWSFRRSHGDGSGVWKWALALASENAPFNLPSRLPGAMYRVEQTRLHCRKSGMNQTRARMVQL